MISPNISLKVLLYFGIFLFKLCKFFLNMLLITTGGDFIATFEHGLCVNTLRFQLSLESSVYTLQSVLFLLHDADLNQEPGIFFICCFNDLPQHFVLFVSILHPLLKFLHYFGMFLFNAIKFLLMILLTSDGADATWVVVGFNIIFRLFLVCFARGHEIRGLNRVTL